MAACRLPIAPELMPLEPTATAESALVLTLPVTASVTPEQLQTATPTPQVSGNFKSLMQLAGAPQGKLQDERLEGNGGLWVTSEKGIYLYGPDGWQGVLEGDAGRILGTDQSGSTWVLLDNSSRIAAVKDQKATIYDAAQGWDALKQIDAF